MNIHLQVLYTTSTLIIGGITNIQTNKVRVFRGTIKD